MIKIKYIPNIFKQDGRITKEFPCKHNKKVSEYLKESGISTEKMQVIKHGEILSNLDIVPNPNDEIIVKPKVGDGIFWASVGSMIWKGIVAWGASMWAQPIAWGMFYISVGYSIYQYANRPQPPSQGGGFDDSSPTYGWDGARTTMNVGIPIPVVYGEHRVGGNFINQYVYTDHDKNYFNGLIALCEGEIESISDIYINEQPTTNFDGITTNTKLGTGRQTQTVIPNFEDLHNVYSIGNQMLKDSDQDYTTTGTAVEAFEIRFKLPNGLYSVSSDDGAISAWENTYQLQYRVTGDPAYTDLESFTISDRNKTTLRRVHRVDGLTAGQYDIKITKTSENEPTLGAGTLYLEQIDEIETDDLSYPYTALLGIEVLATDQISGSTPNITSLVKGIKVSAPKVMNGAVQIDWEDYYWNTDDTEYQLISDNTSLTWDGATYVAQYCANPVWCLKDFLTNDRYGLGQHIASTDFDDTDMVSMSKYCEELVPDGEGGYEKRFVLNIVIDFNQRAMDVIMLICATFNASPIYTGGKISFKIDRPLSPTQLFGMGNILRDSFSQGWKSIKDVPNIIEIQYADKDSLYKTDTLVYMDESSLTVSGTPIRKHTIRLHHTKKSYALRAARYAMKVAKYIDRSFSFKVGIDAVACQAGDVVSISHDVPQIGYSGRVQADSTTTLLKLDRTMTLAEGKTYYARVRFADDTIEEKAISDVPGDYTEVTTAAFTATPAAYDVYAIGETDKVKMDVRITSIKRAEEGVVSIEAVEYDANVYDDSDVTIPTNNVTSLTDEIPDVQSLALTERIVKLPDGTIENVIDVWWEKPNDQAYFVRNYHSALVMISDDGGSSYRRVGVTTDRHFQIIGDLATEVEYTVAVVSVDERGRENAVANSPSTTITMVGKSAVPEDVSSFLVNQDRDRIFFGWTEVSDVDIWGYEIKLGASWVTGRQVAFVQGDSYISTNFKTGSSQKYFIKAIDTSGNYSENATQATVTVDSIPFRNLVTEYSEQTDWAGTKNGTEVTGNNLKITGTAISGNYVTPVRDVGYVATFYLGIEDVVSVTAGTAFDSDATKKFNDNSTERFTGTEAPGATRYDVSTSEDNVTWSAWATWQSGDYKCRYFKLKQWLMRDTADTDLQCSTFDSYADLPDVDEYSSSAVTVSVAATGADVTFTKTYHETPVIAVDIASGYGTYYKITSLDTTGFTCHLYDSAGTLRTGTFNWKSHGI